MLDALDMGKYRVDEKCVPLNDRADDNDAAVNFVL